jgi:hypothetical protein
MATVIPVDEFVTDEWYPGFKPAYDHAPWIVDPVNTFQKKDEETFWFLDFHWPRGMTPMGWIWNEDGYNWGTQLAAETLPLPPGRGITSRFAGTHIYGSSIPVTDPREIGARAKRIEKSLPPFLQNFDEIWATRREEVEDAWGYFRGVDLNSLSLAELGDNLRQARAYHKRSFEIHFEVMYPLLANFVGFYGQCVEFGLDPGEIGKFLQGYDTKIMETDRELWRLTSQAKTAGLEGVFAGTEAEQLRSALSRHGGSAGTWLTQFDDFLQVYGWRTEGSCDIALPSWIEDPTPALGMVKTFLQKPVAHDFEAARAEAIREREEAIDAARSRLTKEEQAVFDGELPVVAGRPQLLHGPQGVASDAVGLPGHRRARRSGQLGRHVLPVLAREHEARLRREDLRRLPDDHRGAEAVLRPLARAPRQHAEDARDDPGHRRRPDPHRDLRPQPGLPPDDQGRWLGRGHPVTQGHRGVQGHRARYRPGAVQCGRAAPGPAR